MITGKKIIALGYKPGKWFKEVIGHANKHQLSDAELIAYIDTVVPATIDPHEQPIPYYKNIEAASVEEETNVAKVFRSMDLLMRTPTLVNGAVMPDACPTGGDGQIPVGGIAVAKNAIHPSMHSADICCSVMMTNLGHIDPKEALDAAHSITHFGPGGRKDKGFEVTTDIKDRVEHNPLLRRSEKIKMMLRSHLGTQGDGNHFLFMGRSEQTGETMMVTHHGSRGFGAMVYKIGMQIAENFRKEISPKTKQKNAWIPYDTPEGEAYWDALQIVRDWTKLNHNVLHDATYQKLGIEPIHRFWNEHNFVFKDQDLFYHAKGATPLDNKFVPDAKDGLRLIPLNMSEPVLIVKGETTANNLGFAPHGAGRNVSRSQHKRKHEGKTARQIFNKETKDLDIRFFSKNIDISELPSAYKNAQAVQEQMNTFGLGEVVDKILPYGSIMAGDWEKDAPWRKKRAAKKALVQDKRSLWKSKKGK